MADFWPLAGFLVFSLIGQTLIVISFNHGPASIVAPFVYGNIVIATILGFVMFGDFPATLTWVGIAIVVASGIYIAVREGRLRENNAA